MGTTGVIAECSMPTTRNRRVASIRPLAAPAELLSTLPLDLAAALAVEQARDQLIRILNGADDRLIVVVGPCSVHDRSAVLDYAERLRQKARELADDLCIVMRLYFEKPRTSIGWKGLINDPYLDNTCSLREGLRLARRLLLEIVGIGLPPACEFLDPISAQFLSDAIAWGAIGARTTESQVHRELASGLSSPIGFKNGTDGRVQIAIDAVRAAATPHSFFGVADDGRAAIVSTRGNPDCHVILRGGDGGPNFDAGSVRRTLEALGRVGLPARLMIDASHGNSQKDYRRQPLVVRDVADQVAAGQTGIIGVMIESFLVEGRQEPTDRSRLIYGQSITDGCIGWETTVGLLDELAEAVRRRRL